MKLFKGLRGFLRRRIPFLKKKKNDKVPEINAGFEDFDGFETCEDVGEVDNAELNDPVPSVNSEDENKSNTRLKNEISYDRPNECSQSPPEASVILDCPLPTSVLDEESCCNIGMTSKIVGLNKDVKHICTDSVEIYIGNNNSKEKLLPPKDLGNKKERIKRLTTQQPELCEDYSEMLKDIRKTSVDTIGQILRRNIGMTSKTVGFNKDVKHIHTESAAMSIENNIKKEELMPSRDLDKKTEGADYLTTQELQFCDNYNEKLKDIRQISLEKNEILGRSSNPDNNDEFEVDFEAAFGPNMKASICEDSWPLVPSKEAKVFVQRTEQYFNCQLELENDKEVDRFFDAFFQMDRNISRRTDSFDGAFEDFPDSTPRKEDCKKLVSNDNLIECFSNEEKPSKYMKKKKMKVVIRDRPLKNPVFEKLFLFSDVDNELYLREIKDPMKRKDAVRSDITEFKHVPAWDSTNMKKYYSDGDLLRSTPDISMAFTNMKE